MEMLESTRHLFRVQLEGQSAEQVENLWTCWVLITDTLLGNIIRNIAKLLSVIFITFGEGGRFSSSENEGERGFRRLRVGLGVAGGEGDGVVGWDFPIDCSESSWRSSCISEPESSLRESSSSKSSSSPLPCEQKDDKRSLHTVRLT